MGCCFKCHGKVWNLYKNQEDEENKKFETMKRDLKNSLNEYFKIIHEYVNIAFSEENEKTRIKIQIEDFIHAQIYDKIYSGMAVINDINIFRKCFTLKWIKPTMLNEKLTYLDEKMIQMMRSFIRNIDDEISPNNKLREFEKLDLNENKKNEITENEILSKISKMLIYFVSSRFPDKKIGYNLILLFIEKINQAKKINPEFNKHMNILNEQIILSLSEFNVKEKSDLQKIFINRLHKTLYIIFYCLNSIFF